VNEVMCYRKITNRQGISSEGLKNEASTIKKGSGANVYPVEWMA